MASSSLLRKDVTGFVVLLAFLLLAAFVLMSSNGDQSNHIVSVERDRNPSIDNTRSSGSCGLYEWTGKLGYKPEAWRKDFLDLPDDASVLFCIAPDAAFDTESDAPSDSTGQTQPKRNTVTAAEGRAVVDWVSKGHTFVLLASSLPTAAESAKTDTGDEGDDDDDNSDGTKNSTFSSELGVDVEQTMRNSSRRQYAPLQPSKLTDGVGCISIHPGAILHLPNNSPEVLFGDVLVTPRDMPIKPSIRPAAPKVVTVQKLNRTPGKTRTTTTYSISKTSPQPLISTEPIAVTYKIGKGRVVAVSDDVFACNANLFRADNSAFIYRILSTNAKPGATILFDEFHRDFGGEQPSIWAATTRPFQLAIIQILLAAAVALVVLIPRLGRAEPLPDQRQRSSAEYVTSLAGLYQNAGATTTALEIVYRQFLREACNRFRLPTDITLDRLAMSVARRGRVNEAEVRKLLVACEQGIESGPRLTERDLIMLVRGIERLRKDLGIA